MGEAWLGEDFDVELFFEVLSATVSAMAVENRKNLDVGPGRRLGLVGPHWVDCVQNYRNSIFVVVSDQTAMSVGRKTLNTPKSFVRCL